MKAFSKTDNSWRSLVEYRLRCLQYIDDQGAMIGFGGDSSTTTEDLFSQGVQVDGASSDLGAGWGALATTASSNPSLSLPPSDLSLTGGAPLNTVSPNPTLYSSGTQGVASNISSLAQTIGQWGFGISSLLGSGAPTQASLGTQPYVRPVTSSNTKLIWILLGVGLVVLLVMSEE